MPAQARRLRLHRSSPRSSVSGPSLDLPIVGVHVHLLPTGKILMWQHESTSVPYLWDPVVNNGTFDPVPIHSNQNGTRRDSIYCAGHSFLPDGRLFATGGHIEPLDDTVHGSKLTTSSTLPSASGPRGRT